MSTSEIGSSDPRYDAAPLARDPQAAGWVTGLAFFAGAMMIMIGVFQIVAGLVALFENEVYVAGTRYLFAFDLTTWGWIHLLLGALVAAAGIGVLSGQLWGRIVGITLALLSAFANFLFIPYYPVWSLLVIALDVFVIWALCLYNRDAARA
jgi:vacuolar-type H+-ATPase subunit I/STV1